MTRRRACPSRDGGQATVELALALPFVLLLLLAILQVGLLARDTVLVTHASREGARAAATDPEREAVVAAARRSSGLDADRMGVEIGERGDPGSTVTVVVTYRAPTDVPLVGALLGDHTIRSRASMRVEATDNRDEPARSAHVPAVPPIRKRIWAQRGETVRHTNERDPAGSCASSPAPRVLSTPIRNRSSCSDCLKP